MSTAAGPPVIEVGQVAKRYRRSPAGGPRRLRRFDDLFRRVDHWALRDVSFTVQPGETLGLVGANGSGKSTLLRLVGGITRPTSGTITVRRRVSGLLTLGESFQPVLSAEENALTAAILAGLTRRQALRRLPEIAAFAELEDVLDQPLRTFSDGMRLRLGFAVSVHVDPELLLIDEILAVGDVRFRRKCLEYLTTLRATGVTVVVTSHEMGQVVELCDRAIWLADGQVHADGPAEDVADRYRNAMSDEGGAEAAQHPGGGLRLGTRQVEVHEVRLGGGGADDPTAPGASGTTRLRPGGALRVEIDYVAHEPVLDAIFVVSAHSAEGVRCFDLSTAADGQRVGRLHGPGTVSLGLDRLDLSPGPYQLDVGIYEASWAHAYDYLWAVAPFEVTGEGPTGLLSPPHRWEVR